MSMESSTGANRLDFARLRDRFQEIASRRVDASTVEDIVHDALRIVVEKGGESPELSWCFQVLRNVIGNHYRRQRTRSRFVTASDDDEVGVAGSGPTPLERVESEQVQRLLDEGIARLGPPCAGYLAALLRGESPAAIAADASLEPAVFYRRLYRCRRKLREWLESRGVIA